MSTKINGVDGGRSSSLDTGRPGSRRQDVAGGAQAPAPADSSGVRITGAASQLAALEQALRDLPAVDEARVAAVRTAIEQGRYTILPQHIADQLLQLEQSLSKLAAAGTDGTAGTAGASEPE